MTPKSFNMTHFRHSIYLNAYAEDVFRMVTTGDGIAKWFIGDAVYTGPNGRIKPGDEPAGINDNYKWQWLAKDFSVKGIVLDIQSNLLFKFTFGSIFNVTISFGQKGNRTLLTLEQEYSDGARRDDFAHINCCACWVFFLTNLKSVIEHGIDLRETEVNNEELVNR